MRCQLWLALWVSVALSVTHSEEALVLEGWGGPNIERKEGLGSRNGGGKKLMVMRHGGSKATENAVDSALAWLARHQEVDGHFDAQKYEAGSASDTSVTALALLAFLGTGHSEKVGTYKDNVQRAMAWLISKQKESGLIFSSEDEAKAVLPLGHPHALAGWALAEAAGLGRVSEAMAAAQKAVDYSVNVQQHVDKDGRRVGWGMTAGNPGDTRTSACFIMQLKMAKVAGLKVPPEAFDGAIRFLDTVQRNAPDQAAKDPAKIAQLIEHLNSDEYDEREAAQKALADMEGTAESALREALKGTPTPEIQKRVRELLALVSSACRYTSAADVPLDGEAYHYTVLGSLCRMFLGWKKENVAASVEWAVTKRELEWGENGAKADFSHWHFVSLCAFQQGGELWKTWNQALKEVLLGNQRKGGDEDGSWDPVSKHMDRFGRVASTALGALCLETYYRY